MYMKLCFSSVRIDTSFGDSGVCLHQHLHTFLKSSESSAVQTRTVGDIHCHSSTSKLRLAVNTLENPSPCKRPCNWLRGALYAPAWLPPFYGNLLNVSRNGTGNNLLQCVMSFSRLVWFGLVWFANALAGYSGNFAGCPSSPGGIQ